MGDGCESSRGRDEVSPGIAAGLDDGVVGVVDAQGEVVLAQILPDVLDRVEFGGVGRQTEERDVVWWCEGMAGVPAGAVEHEYGMSAWSHRAADLAQMEVHGFAVGVGHHQGSANGAFGADSTEVDRDTHRRTPRVAPELSAN